MATNGHPTWCDPSLCDMTDPDLPTCGGAHRSKPRDLDPVLLSTDRGPIKALSASLYRAAAPWPTSTYLILLADGQESSMPLDQASCLLAQLVGLVELGRANQ